MAELLNEFFIEKVRELARKNGGIECEDPFRRIQSHLKDRDLPTFSLRTVSEEEILWHIKKLKNSKRAGIDGISTSVIKRAVEVPYVQITWIVNSSIVSGIFPDRWKIATVVPLHKKGNQKEAKNYRPVSLLPVVSKVLESVVRRQITKHLEANGHLPKSQHGFRENRSTSTALLSMVTGWRQKLVGSRHVRLLLFNISSAFDTINTEILCEKLSIMKFDEMTMAWIRSYMSER